MDSRHGARLDGDAALALQLHVVQAGLHLLLLHGPRQFEDSIGQGGFPWSMCAMIEKLRMYLGSTRGARRAGSAVLEESGERGFELPERSALVTHRGLLIA